MDQIFPEVEFVNKLKTANESVYNCLVYAITGRYWIKDYCIEPAHVERRPVDLCVMKTCIHLTYGL
jgi:hypothetical protein